jgi:hypothetical protein
MDAPTIAPRRNAPWTGRRRVKDPKARLLTIRWSAEQYAAVSAMADQAGMPVGTFLRTLALGSPGPRATRKPPIERRELARLLGELGKIGSNVNQIAKAIHQTQNLPSWSELASIREDVTAMRAAVMTALGRDP